MPFRKIKDMEPWMPKSCRHPDHYPPNMIVLEPGVYEYEYPACGLVQQVVVPAKPTL